ncbi:MAG: hypothetical protein GTN76_06955, partial [Candidatus Aenigmarchaeota archaeon]|nr:hypothetical protein [Candidatus Aenigmarchaeota archaeon]
MAADCTQANQYVDCCSVTRHDRLDPDSYKEEPAGSGVRKLTGGGLGFCAAFNMDERGYCFNQEKSNDNFYDRCLDCTHVDECFVRGCTGCEDYSVYASQYGMPSGAFCGIDVNHLNYVCERGFCKPPRQYGESCTEGWDCQCESGCCMDVAAPPPPPPPPPPECGDGTCDPGEDEFNCPEDCAGGELSRSNGYGVYPNKAFFSGKISYQSNKRCRRAEGDACASDDECCTKNNYGCHLSPITGTSHCCPDSSPYWNGAECKASIPLPVASITDVSTTWVSSDEIFLACSDTEGDCDVTMYCVDLERICYPTSGPPGGIAPPNCTDYPSTCNPDTVYSYPFNISFDAVMETFGEDVTSAYYNVKYYSRDNAGNQETTQTSPEMWFWRFGGFASASSTPGSYETDVSSKIKFGPAAPTTTISYSVVPPTSLSYLLDGTLSIMCYHPVNQDPYPCNLTVTLDCYGTSGADCLPTKWYYFDSDGTCSTSKSDYTSSTTDSSITVNTDRNDWLCLWVEDTFGNSDIAVSTQLMVDATGPTASITGVSGTWVSSDDITLSCSDTGGSGCTTNNWYYFDSDGTCSTSKTDYTSSTTSSSITINTNHNDWLCLWVEDNAGNNDIDVSSQLMVDIDTPATTISPDGGDFTGSSQADFTLTCSDTGGSGCDKTYYRIIDDIETCGTPPTGYTEATSGTVTCPQGQICDKMVCFYSEDSAGNQESVIQSSIFHLETGPCVGKVCGESCTGEPGICNGTDPNNCYTDGGCFLDCTTPNPGSGNQRIWQNSNCGRTGSYKCGLQKVCSNSYTSCTTGGSPMEVTGSWSSYTYPSGSFGVGDTFQITLSGISSNPSGFTIVAECSVIKPDGIVIYFNNWGSGDLSFSYIIQSGDSEGTWTLDYCGLWSDFLANEGWNLQFDNTDYTFLIDKTPPTVSVTGAPVNWQNTDATASVSCSDPAVGSGCDSGTYVLLTYTSDPGSCPSTHASYTLSSPQTISTHVWVCAAANDSVDNTGFSTPVEFRIEKTDPIADISDESTSWVTSDDITLSCSDTGGSGCVSTKWYYFDSDGVCSTSKTDYTSSTTSSSITVNTNHNDWICLWVEDNAGNNDIDVSSQLMVDTSPPTTPVVTDDGEQTSSLTTLHATWSSSDPESGIAEYQYAIGTDQYPSSGWNSEVDWTSTGMNTEITRSDLSLSQGQTYYFNVRARNNADSWSSVGYSDGIIANVCYQQICGISCPGGICDGNDNCYAGGGCLLNCSAPAVNPPDERRWINSNCGRTDSYKCGPQHVCSNSYTSCTTGGISTQVIGFWTSYTQPSGTYYAGDTITITLNGVSNTPSGFTILAECSVIKPDGSTIFFDNWGSGDLTFSYQIQPTDPLGTWTIDYCGLWSDFEANGGWNLNLDNTDYTFTVDSIQLTVSVT